MEKQITRIINFWFNDCVPRDWFKKDKYFDSKVKNNFGDLVEDALLGYISSWHKSLDGSLAFILLTDQFTRNIFRGTPKSFSGDIFALDTCLHCLNKFDKPYTKLHCQFLLIALRMAVAEKQSQ